jgi:hypothetical protein
MWMLVASLAVASEIPAPLPAPGDDASYEQRWQTVDIRASQVGRTGTTLVGLGFGSAAMGLLLASYGGDRQTQSLVTVGSAFVGVGIASTFAGIPLTLAGSMRSARSMQARGVHVPMSAGKVGWTCFGLSLLVLPAPVTLPVSLAMGFVQMDVNRRFRENAGLPEVRMRVTAEF